MARARTWLSPLGLVDEVVGSINGLRIVGRALPPSGLFQFMVVRLAHRAAPPRGRREPAEQSPPDHSLSVSDSQARNQVPSGQRTLRAGDPRDSRSSSGEWPI